MWHIVLTKLNEDNSRNRTGAVEVLTAVRMTMLFFWAEDGDSMSLRNVDIYKSKSLHDVKTPKNNIVRAGPVDAKITKNFPGW
jgi:hypothetical protein